MPGHQADALYVPAGAKYQRDLLALTGLDELPVVETRKHRAVSADRLIVPCLPNPKEVAPTATVECLRSRLPARAVEGLPKRIYVTRGTARNTRRVVNEDELMPHLGTNVQVHLYTGLLLIAGYLLAIVIGHLAPSASSWLT